MQPEHPCGAVAAGEDGGVRGAVDLRQGDQHRRLDGAQALRAIRPFVQRLELQRLRRNVRNIQAREHRDRALAVVIGRAADEAEPGEGDQRVDFAREIGVHRGPRVETAGEDRDHAVPGRLEGADDMVVMRGVGGEHIAAQEHDTDRAARAAMRQVGGIGGDPVVRQVGVVEPHIGILDRQCGLDAVPVGTVGIARDQEADQPFDIVVGAAQPILHRQEPGAQILRLAGQELQDLGQAAQHLHLPRAGRPFLLGGLELLQERHRPGGRARHVELAHLGELHDGLIGDDADHRVAMVAAGLQVGQDRLDMLFEEDHRGDDDIRPRDVGARGGKCCGILAPLGGRMDRDLQAGEIVRQPRRDARGRAGRMAVQRHQRDPVGPMDHVIAQNGPSLRRGCRRRSRRGPGRWRRPRCCGVPCRARRTGSS